MTFWSEVRSVIAVAAVVLAIVALFRYLPTVGDDAAFEASFGTTTTITQGVASTTPVTTIAEREADLCTLADEFVAASESELFQYPGKTQQLAEEFYIDAYDVAVGVVRAEYAAARDYYIDYNDIADPANYDPLTLIAGPDAARFKQLSTREPNGVAQTIANVGFLCGAILPGPPLIPVSEYERLEKSLEDE